MIKKLRQLKVRFQTGSPFRSPERLVLSIAEGSRRTKEGLPSEALPLRAKEGQILVYALLFMAVILIMTISTYSLLGSFLSFSSRGIGAEQVTNLADAGVDYALWQLNQTSGAYLGTNGGNPGCTGAITLGAGQVTIQVVAAGSNKKITATGYIPTCASSKVKRVVKVEVTPGGIQIPILYTVHSGRNGINFSQNNPKEVEEYTVVRGNVFANGYIGDHPEEDCREKADGPPTCKIYGQALATDLIDDKRIKIIPGPEQENYSPPQPLPTIDVAFWEAAAAAQGVTDCGNDYQFDILNQVNYELKGKFDSPGGQCNITVNNSSVIVKSPVHINGNLDVTNSTIKLDDGFGSAGTVVQVDRSLRIDASVISGTSQVLGTSSDPRGYILFYIDKDGATSSTQVVIPPTKPHQAIYYSPIEPIVVSGQSSGLRGPCPENDLSKLTGAVIGYRSGGLLNDPQAPGVKIRYCLEIIEDPNLLLATFSTETSSSSWSIRRGTYKITVN